MGSCEYLSGELELESGFRQLVLALLTLSRGGCRSLGSQHAIQRREGKGIKKTKDAKEQANNIRSKRRMGFIKAHQSKREEIRSFAWSCFFFFTILYSALFKYPPLFHILYLTSDFNWIYTISLMIESLTKKIKQKKGWTVTLVVYYIYIHICTYTYINMYISIDSNTQSANVYLHLRYFFTNQQITTSN